METIELIKKYEFYVKEVNNALLGYFEISISPYRAYIEKKIPQKAKFNFKDVELDYYFHGKGIHASINGILIDFDYSRPKFEYIGLDQWKFISFLSENGFVCFQDIPQKVEYLKKLEVLASQGFLIMNPNLILSEKLGIMINKSNEFDYRVNYAFKA